MEMLSIITTDSYQLFFLVMDIFFNKRVHFVFPYY